jgi:hypothetical protein
MMRVSLFCLVVIILFSFCKAKKTEAITTRPSTADNQTTIGTISHKHGKCGTVVLVKAVGVETILVPYPALDKEYDVDGLSIKFSYRKLRMPQREGCDKGIMAELKEIEKSN